MTDLSIQKFHMSNPLVIASSPATQGVSAVLKSASALPGAVVMRNFGHGAGGGTYIYPSAAAMEAGQPVIQSHAEGTQIQDVFRTLEEYCEGLHQARTQMPEDVRLWASVGHFLDTVTPGVDWERDWCRQAHEMELAGADALELHFNTPGVATARNRVYDFYRMIYNTTRSIKAVTKLPVMVKLPVEACDPLRAMEAAVFGGADAIGPTARWRGFAFELDWRQTLPRPGSGYGCSGALPVICFNVAEARTNGITTPMYAGGGIYNWEAAAKIIMAGSEMVQLGSIACCVGPEAVSRMKKKLAQWMEQNGYASIEELKGQALPLFTMPPEQAARRSNALGQAYRLQQPDPAQCVGCGKCVQACWYDGIVVKDGKAQKTDRCIGCGYCFAACPVKALSLDAQQVIAQATEL